MPRATLLVTIPPSVWIGDLSRAHPDATFRVLAAMPGVDSGVGLLEITGSSPEPVVAELDRADAVTDCRVLSTGARTTLVQVESTDHTLLAPIQRSGAPFELPITINDGEATLEVTAPRDRLSELATALESAGIAFTVASVVPTGHAEQPLTDRQWSLVRVALEQGYYDTPRGCSLTALADEVGLAKSTCSETLHRAEGRIVKQFLREHSASLG